jgi:hypothetical protein
MGSGFVGLRRLFGLRVLLCKGDQIKQELDRVFLVPGSSDYRAAQRVQQQFYDVANGTNTQPPGRWYDLYKAYKAAGVAADSSWAVYLSTLGARNIMDIAQARYDGLSAGQAIHTQTHPPGAAHQVIVTRGNHITIDSPFTPDPGCST